MLLPQHELDHFSYFKTDYKWGTDKGYNTTCHDEISIFYSKEKSFLGYKYRKEWRRIHSLTRVNGEGGWSQSKSTSALIAQLQLYESNNWNYVDKKTYDTLTEKFPEMFL